MDQLHEELKEPIFAETGESDSSDTDDKREGDRSPSEEEFLSCDSSSDRGEGDGQSKIGGSLTEPELLIQDDASRRISEKERMKDRKFSYSHRRSNSEQVDEDADVDTSVVPVDGRASPEAIPTPTPRPASPPRTPGTVAGIKAKLSESAAVVFICATKGRWFRTGLIAMAFPKGDGQSSWRVLRILS